MSKKSYMAALLLMAVCVGSSIISSCSKDDIEEIKPISVVIKDDGTTSNGSIFSAIDDKNYYLDYIKYTVKDGHLAVSGYDKAGFKGVANIVSKITYKGNTYEVLEIEKNAFYECSTLTSITIPNSVTIIGSDAFSGCNGLTSITIPNSVTSIGEDAFEYCSRLTSVHITDLTAWCIISFSNASSNPLSKAHHLYLNGQEVKELVIPNTVTSIGNYAFRLCYDLTSVTIPNSVTSIGSFAFQGCIGLTSITIPNSVTRIYDYAFNGCYFKSGSFINRSSLTRYDFWGATLCDEETQDGLLIKNNIVVRCRPWATSIMIPNSVTKIGNGAFSSCNGLTSITIPASVTSIGGSAFSGCNGLTSITIPNSVTSIGEDAFGACSNLTSITIGNSVTSIGDYAFYSCSSLTSVIVNRVTPPTISYYTFYNLSNVTLYVPIGCKTIYETAAYWRRYFTEIIEMEF